MKPTTLVLLFLMVAFLGCESNPGGPSAPTGPAAGAPGAPAAPTQSLPPAASKQAKGAAPIGPE